MIHAERYDIELEGICPIKMDKWLDDPQPKSEAGYKELAKKKVYIDDKGNIGIPSNSIKASMRLASSEIGKKMEAKKNRQTIKSAVFFDKEIYLIGKKKPDMIVGDVVTRGQGEKVTRVKTYRPLIKIWKIKCRIIAYGVTKDFVQQSLELAGMRFGLLSHRPEFGRFIVKSFKKVK